MSTGIVTAAYIAASVLFILSLGGLSNQESAKRAVWYGIVGMAIAVLATVFGPLVELSTILVVMIAVGAVIGIIVAQRVEMTGMPQLVAALHSFVGLAAVFIGINSDFNPPAGLAGAELIIHEVEIFLGVFIGAITFTGSIIAYGKLAGSINGKALTLPGRHAFNSIMVIACLVLVRNVYEPRWSLDIVCHDSNRFHHWYPYGDGHWWRRHAGGCFHAEFLFRLGRSGDRLPARQ